MLRFLFILFFIVVAALVASWVSARPGIVDVVWLGYEIRIDMRLLLAALAILLVAYTIGLFILRRIWRGPRAVKESWRNSKRRRGYNALTQGMVAVAAGDPDEALKWSKRAGDLLDNPPLTLLLAAQAATLDGDEQAAQRYFNIMLEQPETRFLGLRGLVQISLRRGDEEAALDYVKEAYDIRPNTPWVLDALFDLAERRGRLEEAVRALNEAKRRKALPRADVDRKRAVLLYEEAKTAQQEKDPGRAVDRAKQALKLAPDLIPAVVLLSDAMVASNRQKDAERALRRAWAVHPHPDLYGAWKRTRPTAEQPDARKKALLRLVSGQPEHIETRLILAESALESGDWAESRSELQAAENKEADARVAELLARLEQAEHGDAAAARSWLETAAGRPASPSWFCNTCQHEADSWTPRCPACGTFDSLRWRAGKPLPDSGLALSPASDGQDAADSSLFTPIPTAEEKPAETAEADAETTAATDGKNEAAATSPPPLPVGPAADKASTTPEEAARRGA